jgi:hypothetical protein
MIIVTGEPRSGTSLMMETIRLLGFEIWGEEQPGEERRKSIRAKEDREETLEERLRREKAKWMNEKFWEIGGLVMRGITSRMINNLEQNKKKTAEDKNEKYIPLSYADVINDHKDHAVKVIWNGLMNTDRDILESSKIVLCLRDPLHIAQSQKHLQGQVSVATNVGDEVAFVSPENEITPMRYLHAASRFSTWLKRPMNNRLEILRVDYDDMVFNTVETINRIADFLGEGPRLERPANSKVELAMLNVDGNRRRSAIPETPEEDLEEWHLVQDLYSFFKDDIFTKEAVEARIQDYEESRKNNPENKQWICHESFWPMNVYLRRDYKSKKKLRNNMLRSMERRKNSKMLCTQCPLYKESEEIQEIELPWDLDNIVRPKVDCPAMGLVTFDECNNHYKQVRGDVDFCEKYKDS